MGEEQSARVLELGKDAENIIRITTFDEENHSQLVAESQSWQQVAGLIIEPPFDPLTWASLLDKNTRLNRLISIMARNTVGLGHQFMDPATDPKYQNPSGYLKARDVIKGLFKRPNSDMPFSELMYRVKVDEEATGNGYIEVVRNQEGKIVQLYHAPSVTMRRMKNGTGYVQIKVGGSVVKYFKNFGDKRVIDATTGKESPAGGLPIEKRATEILQTMLYYSLSSWYGAPRAVSPAIAIAGNYKQGVRNVTFFDNDATPRMVLIVKKGQLDDLSERSIENFIRKKGKGPLDSGRLMILQGRTSKGQGVAELEIQLEPLTIGKTEDASFQKYRGSNDEEIREAFGISNIYLGTTEDINRATAIIARAVTNDQIFSPEAFRLEYILNNTIVADLLGFDEEAMDSVWFAFIRPKITTPIDDASIASIYAKAGGMSSEDVRALAVKVFSSLDLEPYGEEWATFPIVIAQAIFNKDGLQAFYATDTEGAEAAPSSDGDEGNGSDGSDGDSSDGD